MIVNWPKLFVKVNIKIKTYIVVFDWDLNYLFSLKIFITTQRQRSPEICKIIWIQNNYYWLKSLHMWHNNNDLLLCRHRLNIAQWTQGWEVYYKALTCCIQPLKMYGVKFSLSTPWRHIWAEVQLHHDNGWR